MPLSSSLPDSDDEPFLEVALSQKAEYLVTGNIRHFPETKRSGILVILPARFIEIYRSQSRRKKSS
jgi:predicted nucleic acid-binding protein